MGEYAAPQDIREVAGLMKWLISELSDLMRIEVEEWLEEYKSSIQQWKAGAPEPDWQDFRKWMNEICREDGYPLLFAE